MRRKIGMMRREGERRRVEGRRGKVWMRGEYWERRQRRVGEEGDMDGRRERRGEGWGEGNWM